MRTGDFSTSIQFGKEAQQEEPSPPEEPPQQQPQNPDNQDKNRTTEPEVSPAPTPAPPPPPPAPTPPPETDSPSEAPLRTIPIPRNETSSVGAPQNSTEESACNESIMGRLGEISQLSRTEELIKKSGVAPLLSDASQNLTLFAPTNAAWNALSYLDVSVDLDNRPTLQAVMTYLIVTEPVRLSSPDRVGV